MENEYIHEEDRAYQQQDQERWEHEQEVSEYDYYGGER